MIYRKLLFTIALPLSFGPLYALAQEPSAPKARPKAATNGKSQVEVTQATAEMMMNEAVKNIARRYNLNDAQTQKTDEIMKRDVNKFLKDHEAQVWPIIRELMSNGFQPPSNPEDVKRLGKAAAPLFKDAQRAILEGNREWRQYLTPEQQKMHDFDLAEMDKQFVEAERNLKAWEEGRPSGGLFPQPSLDRSPPMPQKPAPGLPTPPPPPEPEVEIFVRESLFDTYVEDFIKQYELDSGQIESARSILAEYKQKAGAFKEANRVELTKVAYEHKAAVDANDRERIAKAEAERKKLLQPAYEMFGEMDERLKALLTSNQRSRVGEKAASKVDPVQDIDPAAKGGAPAAHPTAPKNPSTTP